MRVASDCRQPLTARHASQPRSSTSHPPQQQDAVHRELRPGTGKGAIARVGPLRRATRQAAGPARARPRRCPPRRRCPTRPVHRQQQQARGNEDILLSATCPSTTRCSKDVTTHQHGPGARPGRPCPVPACSGQPLPGERRFSSALGNRVFRSLSLSDDRPFIVLLLVTSCKPLIRVRGKSSPCRLLLCEVCVGKQTGV
jgi:hypothetical protein